MKDTLANKLASFDASLAVVDRDEYKLVWQNKPPLAFGTGLAAVCTAVAGLRTAGAEQSAPTRGATDALRTLRKDFETALHPLARATFRCLTKQPQLEAAAKVDLTPTDLHNARAVALAGLGETVLEFAEPLTQGTPAPGETFGITVAKIGVVNDLWERYSTAVGAPGGARAKRRALTGGLPGKFAAVEAQFSELDDLVVQFNDTPLGKQFVDAWFNSRRVVDLGRRAAHPATPTPPPTPK
jgi:hypothetical protein